MADLTFLVFGMLILLGFIGNLLFKVTKIPEVLFLILAGILIGPVFHIVDQHALMVYAPTITTLMLIIIMLDNGLSFNVFRVFRALPMTVLFALSVMSLTVVVLSILFHYLLALSVLQAVILAFILSGTTTDVISTLLSRMHVPRQTKQLLIFESVINDIQMIPFFVLLHFAETSSLNAQAAMGALIQIPLAILVGALASVWWVYIIGRFLGKHPLNYIATIGLLFMLYNIMQMIGGNGPLAVLTFSLVLGNALNLFRRFNIHSTQNKFTGKVLTVFKEIEVDVSFFVRTIFFVFLGTIFSVQALEPRNVSLALVMLSAILACRYAGARVLQPAMHHGVATWICARGYVAAVLAFAAVGSGVLGVYVLDIVLFNVFLTTGVSIFYALYHERIRR